LAEPTPGPTIRSLEEMPRKNEDIKRELKRFLEKEGEFVIITRDLFVIQKDHKIKIIGINLKYFFSNMASKTGNPNQQICFA